MTRRIMMMLVIAAMVALGVAQAFAHAAYRIIGTVVSLTDEGDGWSYLAVRPQDSRMVKILMRTRAGRHPAERRETLVYRDSKKVRVAELKAGRYVVVDAEGDSMTDLLASEVRIVPSLPK